MSDCPECGYPSKGQYKGLYIRGNRCDGCGFIDTGVSYFNKILNERLEDPKNLPSVLQNAADYMKHIPRGNHITEGIVKVLLAAKKELEKCEQSSEQPQE